MLSTLLQHCIVIVTQIKHTVVVVAVAIRLLNNSHILGSKDLRPASGVNG